MTRLWNILLSKQICIQYREQEYVNESSICLRIHAMSGIGRMSGYTM